MTCRAPRWSVSRRGARTLAVVGSEYRCDGMWIEVAPGVGECKLGLDCEALELLDDFDAYRLAHERHKDPGSPGRRFLAGRLHPSRQPAQTGTGGAPTSTTPV